MCVSIVVIPVIMERLERYKFFKVYIMMCIYTNTHTHALWKVVAFL